MLNTFVMVVLILALAFPFLFSLAIEVLKEKNIQSEKKYILQVTTEHEDGGYSSRWYGWSRNMMFSHGDALKEKKKIQDNYFEVKILEVK